MKQMNNRIERDRIIQKVSKIIKDSLYTWLRENPELISSFTEEKSERFLKTIEVITESDKYKDEPANALFDIYEVLAKIEIDYEDNVVRNN